MTDTKIIIGIIGMPAAGKGTVAEYLASTHHAHKLRFSDALNTILERLNTERTRDNLIRLSEVIRETCGEDVLARSILIGIEKTESSLIVIDGVRRESDIELFRGLPNFKLIAIDTDIQIRYERAKKRAEKPEEANQSFEDFAALDKRSTEVSTAELMKKADARIDNNGTLDQLYAQIDQLIHNK